MSHWQLGEEGFEINNSQHNYEEGREEKIKRLVTWYIRSDNVIFGEYGMKTLATTSSIQSPTAGLSGQTHRTPRPEGHSVAVPPDTQANKPLLPLVPDSHAGLS